MKRSLKQQPAPDAPNPPVSKRTRTSTANTSADASAVSKPPTKIHPFFAAKNKEKDSADSKNTKVLSWSTVGSLLIGIFTGPDSNSEEPNKPSAKTEITETENGGNKTISSNAIGTRIAAFDFDSTITVTAGTHLFSKSADDWRFLYNSTKETIRAQYVAGFRVVIFSNQMQSKEAKLDIFKGKVAQVALQINVPFIVFAATENDQFRKPQTGMWDYFVEHFCNGVQPDMKTSFFVGDAAGRPERRDNGDKLLKKDHSAADYKFALNIGLRFHIPEVFFKHDVDAIKHVPTEWTFDPRSYKNPNNLFSPSNSPLIPTNLDGPELVLFVGPPAAGKTSFAKTHFTPKGYVHVNQDTLKDRKKCIEATIKALKEGKSVVVDNTNPSASVRQEYISAAKKCGVTTVRALYFTAPIAICEHNNHVRVKLTKGLGKGIERERLPTMVFNMFKKNLEIPEAEKEGLSEVTHVNFVADFKSNIEKVAWSRFYL
ncbi:hypothetical protein HK100_004265 [Physocladia obscura]|uniref:Bifunctional polynucleotide phosphatase/kinase n=1 Tax=Physocladia obscura TaxID=109957 RepID=A0AAD5SYS5_9FUNG|nr:hypothetical protein HK100_004265 [Physocladia obscura]